MEINESHPFRTITYRAAWKWRSLSVYALHIVMLGGLVMVIVSIALNLPDLWVNKKVFAMTMLFLLALIVAANVWFYGLLMVFATSYTLSFDNGILHWSAHGSPLGIQLAIPVRDIVGTRLTKSFARFRYLRIFTAKRSYGLSAVLSEKDIAHLMDAIIEEVESARP